MRNFPASVSPRHLLFVPGMNEFSESPKIPRAKKRSAKKSARRLPAKKPAPKKPKNGQKSHASALRREAKAKTRSGTKLGLDYCEAMHRIFMDQQNDPNPLRKFITVK